jgi:hypothetical protein
MANVDILNLVDGGEHTLHASVASKDYIPPLSKELLRTLELLNGKLGKPTDGSHFSALPLESTTDATEPAGLPNISPHSSSIPKFELEDHGIDEARSLRVVVIGAGLSGILAGILLPAKVPNIDLTIYEKNDDVVSEVIFPFEVDGRET